MVNYKILSKDQLNQVLELNKEYAEMLLDVQEKRSEIIEMYDNLELSIIEIHNQEIKDLYESFKESQEWLSFFRFHLISVILFLNDKGECFLCLKRIMMVLNF